MARLNEMERRTNETPMDFEWQSHAPGDVTSPFYQLAMQHQNQNKDKKRPHSIFNSPVKPSTPALRDPSSQPFLFNQTPATSSTPLPRSSAFMTPRGKADLDFSSGAENFSSPENADNDETPEKPGKADRRNSLFNFYGRFAPSPGRGEIPRSNKYSNALVTRVHKRRRRDREIDRKLQKAEDDDDDNRPNSSESASHSQGPPKSTFQNHEISFFSRLFTFLESHPHIPRILSYYAQFLFNLILAFLTLYIIVAFLLAIQADVDRESEKVSADILADMAVCAKNYMENRCSGEDGRRLPALEAVCENWERCMNRDPAKVGRAKVSAQTLAEIFNGFIEPISFKTMFFFIAFITSCFAVSNLTFSFFRNKSNNPPSPSMHHPYMPYPPQSMHQQPQIPYTPGHHQFGQGSHYFEPQSNVEFNQHANISPRKANKDQDDWQPKRIAMRSNSEYAGHANPRTPSPIKRERTFA
ncbi:hypothetical protein AJ79_05313 [Helicocarpus griseus UAMH5409]|uniref:Brl1/Brr6 domain-containing protein n=1 Tax=Helicocarpus griseus UAMH5409 TaxID=1447875 RepID=A0A2B7XQ03_9EURO|nr:hypothetical protein AJ79_05313 [Helicocarpus griseus UAMH5409]